MKKLIFVLSLTGILFTSCINSTKSETKGSGACKKCTCPSFREDATDGTCLNNKVPSTALCGHTSSDHK